MLIYNCIFVIFVFFTLKDKIFNYFMYKSINYFFISDKLIKIDYRLNENSQIKYLFMSKSLKYDEIYIYIDSPGGQIYMVNELQKIFKAYDGKIKCIAKNANSAAFDLFQLCDERYVLPNSKLMQHEARIEYSGTVDKLREYCEVDFDAVISYVKKFDLYSAKRIGIPYKEYIKKLKLEWSIKTGAEAVKLNVADEVVNFDIPDDY